MLWSPSYFAASYGGAPLDVIKRYIERKPRHYSRGLPRPEFRGLRHSPVNLKMGLWSLPILIAVGIGSVLQWHWTVRQDAGDLRFYGTVQLYAVLGLLTALFLPPRYTRGSDLLVVAGLYVLAKVFETADRQIFSIGHLISGHTLKHLASGLAGFWILRMLQKRRPISQDGMHPAAEPTAH